MLLTWDTVATSTCTMAVNIGNHKKTNNLSEHIQNTTCYTDLHVVIVLQLHHSAMWNLRVEMILEIKLHRLIASFQCCILEREWMEIGEMV
jgi:hypothetical protein